MSLALIPLAVWAALGHLLVYLLFHRTHRLRYFFAAPKGRWQVLCFDIFLLASTMAMTSLVDFSSRREAFTFGCALGGIMVGVVGGFELSALRQLDSGDSPKSGEGGSE